MQSDSFTVVGDRPLWQLSQPCKYRLLLIGKAERGVVWVAHYQAVTMNPKVTALPNSSVNIPDTRDIWRSHWPLLSFQSLQVSLMPPGCDRWTRARRALQHLQKMPPRSQLSVITGGIEPNVCLQPCLPPGVQLAFVTTSSAQSPQSWGRATTVDSCGKLSWESCRVAASRLSRPAAQRLIHLYASHHCHLLTRGFLIAHY